jgi:hypothetical protein
VGYRLFDQPAHMCVLDDVEDPGPMAAATHQAGKAELGEVLRHAGWLGPNVVGEIVDGVLPMQERPDDPQAGLVAEELQDADS